MIPGKKVPSPGSDPLCPGVYRVVPYSGLVIVPEKHSDERALIATAGTNAAGFLTMPTVKPDLRFVPLEMRK